MNEEARSTALDALGRNLERLEPFVEDLLFVSSVSDGPAGAAPRRRWTSAPCSSPFGRRAGRVVRPTEPLRAPRRRPQAAPRIRHLVDNALAHSDGEIVLSRSHALPESVEVAVVDSGVGIFSGDIPQPLPTGSASSTARPPARTGGAGLGLYVPRRIVEARGGRIWCQSRLGHDSRFAFALPR